MVELKQIFDPDTQAEYVLNHGRYYSIVQECRGVREKFWMVMPDSKYKKRIEPMNISHILLKSSRNDVSCENWGEVYASQIGRMCNLPIVDYYMSTLEKDGVKIPGVMCGSYLRKESEIEISAYDLHQIATTAGACARDNVNTVEGMVHELRNFPTQEFMDMNIELVRRDLYKQAIFDYITAQTDRHWFNTTFLVSFNQLTEKAFVIKAPCYDNGCMAMLKRKAAAIVGMSKEIEKTGGVDSPYLKEQLDKYCPMMGISTPLVHVEKSRKNGEESILVVDNPSGGREIFLDELCRVIADDPELSRFLVELTYNLDVDKITDSLRKNGDNPPESVASLVKNVVGYQLKTLNHYMTKVSAELTAERELKDE